MPNRNHFYSSFDQILETGSECACVFGIRSQSWEGNSMHCEVKGNALCPFSLPRSPGQETNARAHTWQRESHWRWINIIFLCYLQETKPETALLLSIFANCRRIVGSFLIVAHCFEASVRLFYFFFSFCRDQQNNVSLCVLECNVIRNESDWQ